MAEKDQLVAGFVVDYGDMAVERIDCEEAEYSQITEAIQSQPMFTDKKLVILNQPGTQKDFAQNLEELIESISDSVDVIIVEPKPDKRSSYYKLLQKKTKLKTFTETHPRELPRWLSQRAKEKGGSLSVGDAQHIVELAGPNQQLLANELDKLLNYDANITRETIDMLIDPLPQSTIFQLLDAAFTGAHEKALRIYKEQRALKTEPIQLVAMLAWQLHVLTVIKTAGEKSAQAIASEAGISPFVVQKSQSTARGLTMAKLQDMVRELHEIDIKMKSTPMDADEALKYYLLTISS